MKLKKIASLMLAGVMAVSMLAGCSGKTETKPEDDKNEGSVTGVSASFAACLSDDTVKFTDNNSNQSALEKAVKEVEDSAIANVKAVATVTTGTEPLVSVEKALEPDNNIGNVGKDAVKKLSKEATYIALYQAPGAMSQSAVLAQVASKLNDKLTEATLPENSLNNDTSVGNQKEYYTYSYNGSVSAEKVSTKNGDNSAWYVLVTVTVTPTKAELPQG